MILPKAWASVWVACSVVLFCVSSSAGLPPEEVALLGTKLTPLGGEKAGSADGIIPAWTGGVTEPPSNFRRGQHHPLPFPEDEPRFTITAENMAQHADKLTEGHKALLQQYDGYVMNVYPTQRTASAPPRIYEATKRCAQNASLADQGNGVHGCVIGIPFPIPRSGVEVVWNHVLRWRGEAVHQLFGQAPVTRGGDYTMVKIDQNTLFTYALEGATEEGLDNVILMFKQKVLAPARLAGSILLVHETLDQAKEHRKAWTYNPGQRRVRRAPNVAFDNPGTASDGLRTSDQLDMFNGSPERYDWELVGKTEVYVPYNSYELSSGSLKYTDILKPLHLNPEHLRYERHRVWVVDGKLKPNTRHIYKRRVLYVDEDSWQILAAEQYDNRDQLWRVSEGHAINYYEVPTVLTTVEVHYDLQSGRYLALNLNNEEPPYDFSVRYDPKDFTPAAVRREGRR